MKTIVSEKGQITIPKKIRDTMGINPGTVLEIESVGGKMVATKKQPIDVFSKWKGRCTLPVGNNVDEYIEEIRG